MNFPAILLTLSLTFLPIVSWCRRMDAKQVGKWVNDRIAANKVVVFSKTYCPFCVRANAILSEMAPNDVTIFQLESNPDCQSIMDYFGKTTGAATVPRVFIGGKFYGDCSKVVSTKDSGVLRTTLLAAGCKVSNLRGGSN